MTLRPNRRAGLSVAAVAVLTVMLTACSSSGGGSSPQQPAAPSASAADQFGGTGGTGGFGPAASGEIAAKQGKTLQVQSSSAQTAVRYTAKTAFTAQSTTTRHAVQVGSCITAAGSATSSSAIVQAKTVQIASCATARGFSGGRPSGAARPSGVPSGMPGGAGPGGAPSGAPSGAPASRFAGGGGGFVTGTVTAVHGTSMTVKARSFGAAGSSNTSRTVQVSGATVYRTTAKANSSAAKVGTCAVVQGKTDAKGTVTASRIALSPKTNGSCTTGFGTGGPRG